MRSRRKSLNQQAAELNITAFMNLMVILVPFLLITAVFSRMTVLELNLPSLDAASESGEEVQLQLQLVVTGDSWLVRDSNLGDIKRIEPSESEDHWSDLKDVLVEIKSRFPEETAIALLFSPDISYNTMIQIMDRVSSTQLVRVGTLEHVELFPDISLGSAPSAEDG
jgi:biopolymer transport protein ExbD